MPNHGHLIAVPETPEALSRAIGEAHRCYTEVINRREGFTGYLWQGRFASFPMDNRHTLAAARYIELNPIRAGLVHCAEEYRWSSAHAHLNARDDRLVRVAPLIAEIGDWAEYLREPVSPEFGAEIRRHARTGRPLGTDTFIDELERRLGRVLRPRRRGRPPKSS
jgi:putative transposase